MKNWELPEDEHKSILIEAEGLVHGDRNVDYGHPLDDFRRIATMWSQILGVYVDPDKVPLCMIALKISRQCNKKKRDNLVDIAGYAETAAWSIDERKRRGE